MPFSAISIKVGGGVWNRRLGIEVLSFVDVLFVLDPPVGNGGLVDSDDGGRVLCWEWCGGVCEE